MRQNRGRNTYALWSCWLWRVWQGGDGFYCGVWRRCSVLVLFWLDLDVLHVGFVRALCLAFVVIVGGGVVEGTPFLLLVGWTT